MDVKTVMDTWTLQMGFPLVTVTRQYGDKTARVEQTRFIVGGKVAKCHQMKHVTNDYVSLIRMMSMI